MELKIRPENLIERPKESILDLADKRRLCACGRMFTPYRSFQRYCCDEHRIKYGKGKPSTYVKKAYEIKQCKECGKDFRSNDSKRHYCSDECYLSFQAKRRKEPELRICLVCGKEFYSTHWSKRYCNDACRMEAHK